MDGPGWHRERIVTRWEELQADFAQEAELARLEARRIGRTRAQQRLRERLKAERDWFQRTSSRWRPPSEVRDDERD